MNNEVATRIFNDILDDDDLNKMHRSKIITQSLGFKLSAVAIIEAAIDEHCSNLTEENAKLRGALSAMVIHYDRYNANLENISKLNDRASSAKQLLNQLKEQNNDK